MVVDFFLGGNNLVIFRHYNLRNDNRFDVCEESLTLLGGKECRLACVNGGEVADLLLKFFCRLIYDFRNWGVDYRLTLLDFSLKTFDVFGGSFALDDNLIDGETSFSSNLLTSSWNLSPSS